MHQGLFLILWLWKISSFVQFQVFNLLHIFSLILEWCNKMDMTQVWILIIRLPNVSCKCQWKNNTSNSKTCLWLCELWFKRLNALYSFHALIESSFSLWRWHTKNPNHVNVPYLCFCLTFSQIPSFHSKSTLIVDWIGFDNLLKKLFLKVPHFAILGRFPCLWFGCPSIVVKYSTPKMFHIVVLSKSQFSC